MMTFNPLIVIFYVFSSIAVISAIFVITARNPVKSVLSLVVTFFAMAGVWMLLQAEFLSLILLLVYVGAVMTLFLFVVMMLDIDREGRRHRLVRYAPVAFLIALLIAGLLTEAFYLHANEALPASTVNLSNNELSEHNLQALGYLLYTDYVYPFEIAGVILLAAIIAAITLTHRGDALTRRTQDVSRQVERSVKDAVRLVNMPSAKRPPSNTNTKEEGGAI